MFTWEILERDTGFEVIVKNSATGKTDTCGVSSPGVKLPEVEDWLCYNLGNGDRIVYPDGRVFTSLFTRVGMA